MLDPTTAFGLILLAATLAADEPARSHWAFQPPTRHQAPPVRDTSWPRTTVDRFILAQLESRNLEPAPEADRATLLRRLHFDLIGLPPSFEATQAFLADDSPDAYERVADRLLASPHHGERWGRYWLDVARYADTKGYVYSDREERRFVHSATYRDWVVHALNQDLPYDRFLKLQLAADQLEPGDSPDLAAMGFLTLGRRFLGVIHDIIDDRIDTVFRGTQALTVSCARCHDHKFDPIPTLDYYSLYGVFRGSSERTVELAEAPSDSTPTPQQVAYAAEHSKRVKELEAKLTEKKEAVVGRWRAQVTDYLLAVLGVERLPTEEFYAIISPDDINSVVVRQWHQFIFSPRAGDETIFALWRALAKVPPDAFAATARSILAGERDRIHPLVLAAFASATPVSMADVARTFGELFTSIDAEWQTLCASKKTAGVAPPTALDDASAEELRLVLHGPRSPVSVPPGPITEIEWLFDEGTRVELGKLEARIDAWRIEGPGSPPQAVLLVDRPSPSRGRVFLRGNPAQKGEEAPPRFLSAFGAAASHSFERGSGRLELANAIASADNPLTARVMVNRVWLHHFGAGLVRTPSDFGIRAEPPTHPELLDDLAVRFSSEGWSLKRLHRELVASSTYRQSSNSSAVALLADPENRLLGHAHRHRLDFEALRDSLLAASGELDTRLGGKAVDLFTEPHSLRRTIYGLVDRQFLPGTLRVFDVANPDQHTPQRHATTVPQQALFLLNSPFVVGRARAAARQASRGRPADDKDRLVALWQSILGRLPTTHELDVARAYLDGAAEESLETGPRGASAWSYGHGRFDAANGRLEGFTPLPHFTGEAWQGGESWPDSKLGWVQLTATGGHAGNDLDHAAVRRWTAPRAGEITVLGAMTHAHEQGDGIRCRVVLSRVGLLGEFSLHHQTIAMDFGPLEVQGGDTLDFVVDLGKGLNSDDFVWAPVIRLDSDEWNAQIDFVGPRPQPLAPLEALAQALLVANEMAFVD